MCIRFAQPLTWTLFAAVSTQLPAQWPASAAQNLPVADFAGEQAVPKLAVARDGSSYIGWFDHAGANYDVRVQHLDANGVELWPHNGLLISGNAQNTSLVDWDLIADSQGNCVLAFTDIRAGGDLDVYAYRVSATGLQLWGPNGVALSNNIDFEANPRICETTVGDFAFVWPNSGTRTIQLQRLSAAGVPLYPGDGVAIPGDTGQSPAFARVCASDNGAVIAEWVRATAFSAAKHIHVQKYDIAGTAQWNAGVRLPVFDLASLPIAHDPKMIADGQGGCVISWHYAVGSQFFARVQRLTSAGVEMFPHNGVDLSTNGNSKFDPAICFLPSSQSIIAFYNERNVAQTTWGISAQRIDGTGGQAFGPAGINLAPINTDTKFAPVAVGSDAPGQPTAMGFYLVQPVGGLTKKVQGLRIDLTGASQWVPPVDASTVASDKLRLQAGITPSGMAVLAWSDARIDTANIIAQNVDTFGRLGDHTATSISYGCGVNPAGSMVVVGRPSLGGSSQLRVTNPIATQAAGSLAFLVLGFGAPATYPCGQSAPGLGMAPNGIGELLIDLTAPSTSTFGGLWFGSPVSFGLNIPLNPSLDGLPLYAQGALFDTAAGATNPIGLTEGVRLAVGF
jgi:hypothetical protein